MNLEHVASYLAVLRCGGFHAAARQRGLSQTSVSQQVRALEERVGATLVVRDRAGCRPSPGTEEFARYAAALLDLADRTERMLSRPSLVVGASSNIGTYLLQPLFARFTAERSADIDTTLVVGSNAEVADRLTAGTVDVVFMEWWDDRPGFQAAVWREEELVVIVGPDHPWRSRETVTAEELAGQPILGGEPGTGTATLLRQRLGPAGAALSTTMNLGNTEAVKRGVRHGLGISLVLAGAVHEDVEAGRLHALEVAGTPLAKPLWIVHPRRLPASSPVLRFVEAACENGEPGS